MGPSRGTRLQYFASVLRGLQEQLDSQRQELKQEQGLIWLGDPQLEERYKYLHPSIRKFQPSGVRRSDGFHAGVADGREITIRRGVSDAAESRGRLLPGGGGGSS